MTPKEMMDSVRKYVDNKNKAVQTTAEINKTNMIDDCNRVVAQLYKLRDIRPVVSMLFENGLVKGHGTFNHSFDFLTDGIEHGLGFVRENNINFSIFGIAGGGAWGHSVFVDIDSGLFSCDTKVYNFISAEEFTTQTHIAYRNYCPYDRFNYDDIEIREKVKSIAGGIDKYVAEVEEFVKKKVVREIS